MAIEIGRLNTFALGMETTPGTKGAVSAFIPVITGDLKPMITDIKDNSGIGVIDELGNAHITQTTSEFTAEMIARSNSIGWLLLLALGTSTAPTLVETGVYTHSFTRKNDNTHPSATIYRNNLTQDESATYHMLDSMQVSSAVGDYVKTTITTKGQGLVNDTIAGPTFNTADELFVVSKMQIKFASNIAGLAGATPVGVQSANFTINKNLMQIFNTATSATNAVDFASQHNQQFGVTGDFEITYNSSAYRDLAIGLTRQAIQIDIAGQTLIGATKFNNLTFQFAEVVLDSWDRTNDNNGIVNQTFGFTALYNTANTQTMNVVLQNNQATQYV